MMKSLLITGKIDLFRYMNCSTFSNHTKDKSDIHLPNAFRHHIESNDEITPRHWKKQIFRYMNSIVPNSPPALVTKRNILLVILFEFRLFLRANNALKQELIAIPK